MKVIHYDLPGPPDVLKLFNKETPEPQDDQILIKTEAIGVNRPDLLQREGLYPAPINHSKILGLEASGIIKKIGKNVKEFRIGD